MPESPPPHGPWFRRHPHLAMGAAAGLFVAIAVLRVATGDATELLFVLPIALVAQAFGLRAEVVSAMLAIGFMAVWLAASSIDLSALGWASHTVPMLLLGGLIGHASDTQRHAAALATQLAVVEERQRDAAEINDTLVQNLAVAKWKLEGGDVDGGIAMLDTAIDGGQGLVNQLLGSLRVSDGDRRRSRQATVLN